VQVLRERLALEDAAGAQAALLTALGQLRDARALPDVLPRLNSKYDTVCAAAAKALGWIAMKQPLPDEQRQEAVRALVERYKQASGVSAGDGLAVREALLGAMGVLQDKRFLPVLQEACKDANANIRLMGASAIVELKDPEAAEGLLPLLSDADRGVRLLAVRGLAALDGVKHLEPVLRRADPAVESEPSVREAAWTAGLGIFAQSSDRVLMAVCDRLKERGDAEVQRAQVLRVLVDRLREAKSPDLLPRQRELASALMALRRPAEAAAVLAEAMTNSPPPELASALWHEYVDCLLAANDPSVCRVLADQVNEDDFSLGVGKLLLQLEQATTGDQYAVAMAMVAEARRTLFGRLSESRRQVVLDIQAVCVTQQAKADRALVAQQVVALAGADESVRAAATTRLVALGDRAVLPLIDELRKDLTAAKPNPDVEKAVVAILKQLTPHLNNYTLTAPLAEKLARLDDWTKVATSRPANGS
jgi:HEAT repeat protein